MPRQFQQYDEYRVAVQQIIESSSESQYLDQLIAALQDATLSDRTNDLKQSLAQVAKEREEDIERLGLEKHDEFLASVASLQDTRRGVEKATQDILVLNQTMAGSTQQLTNKKAELVRVRAIRQNIAEATAAIKESLKMLYGINDAHELIKTGSYYKALKALDDLQNEHLIPKIRDKHSPHFKLADMIQKSIPGFRNSIAEAVTNDLNKWLLSIREMTQHLGEVAFFHTEQRRQRMEARIAAKPFLRRYKLNSVIERNMDQYDGDAFDILDNSEIQVVFTPLFCCIHIHETLGQGQKFKQDYAATRRQQKDLLFPDSVSLTEDDEGSLSSLLESIAGFAIIEKATIKQSPELRSLVDANELWDSMCTTSISLISKAMDAVDDAGVLLRAKSLIALFCQTMATWEYSVTAFDNFLLKLFDNYAELLKKRYSEEFQDIVSVDDYMPMPVNDLNEYENVLRLCWFSPDKPNDEITFPCVLPFSRMYPVCCRNMREFMDDFYRFSQDRYFEQPRVIDDTLKKLLDSLLSERLCQPLVQRLSTQYLGQIVQILINLECFEKAGSGVEELLIERRSKKSAGYRVVLSATNEFRDHRKTAEKRIFELVNSKIDDLVETAEYDWTAATHDAEPSEYMQELTRYLSNIMSSTLLGLPREIKELIYFDALSHASSSILALPLSPQVPAINPNGVAALAEDVAFLTKFVSGLENAPILMDILDELQQTVQLMQTENPEDFYDIGVRNRKFGRVDAGNGTLVLGKLTGETKSPAPTGSIGRAQGQENRFGSGFSRFGMK